MNRADLYTLRGSGDRMHDHMKWRRSHEQNNNYYKLGSWSSWSYEFKEMHFGAQERNFTAHGCPKLIKIIIK